jgi:hypothetical protein
MGSGQRGPQEIASDMEQLKEAMRVQQQQQQQQATNEVVNSEPVKAEEPKEEEKITNEDDFYEDYDDSEDISTKLASDQRKKLIESRLEPMRVEDLITHGYVEQEVPIIPGKVSYTFRSTSGGEDLGIKKLIHSEAGEGSRYVLDKYSIMNLALSLVKINDTVLPSHKDENKDFSNELFDIKFKKVLAYSNQLIADMAVNFYWFDQRVRELLIAEQLGNG